MKKEFLQFDTVRNNGIKLAFRIYSAGFVPDIIYVSLRGGAYLGNMISEYFKVVHKGERPVYYAAVVARSYTDVAKAAKVQIDGWTYPPERLKKGHKVLLVDDIFDTGRTINSLAKIILDRGIHRSDLKIAVHDYKVYTDKPNKLPIQPDYWCRKHEMTTNDEECWVHYMSHELVGLSQAEIQENYYKQDPDLIKVMQYIPTSS
jgi:hypoxanthine phosphoribosyltransferase